MRWVIAMLALGGCAATPRAAPPLAAERPRSILVVPPLNNTVNLEAADLFLSTVAEPFSARGYYVYPAHLTTELMRESGLGDPGLVHAASADRLGRLFGCDAALYVVIERWDSQTVIVSTTTTVELSYTLKSCKTGDVLWTNRRQESYAPQATSSGSALADLIAQTALSLMEKAAPNYLPLARQANAAAASGSGRALPPGPYMPQRSR